MSTEIQWTDETWNPTVGCTRVSAGCDHCYAFALHDRRHAAWLAGGWEGAPAQYRKPFAEVQLLPERLALPLSWREPRRVFVDSMSDLFHADVPDPFLAGVFAAMALTPRHTYQVLTKRPRRLARLLTGDAGDDFAIAVGAAMGEIARALPRRPELGCALPAWPLPNVWLGVSVESQAAAWRIGWLARVPAALRFLSCEPLLGPIGLRDLRLDPFTRLDPLTGRLTAMSGRDEGSTGAIGWVIAGGESGPKARPMHPGWARSLRDQCVEAGVPFFFKQWGEWAPIVTPEGYVRSEGAGRLGAVLDGNGWRTFRRGEEHGDVFRIGKKAAGRVLDGREWDGMPEVIAR